MARESILVVEDEDDIRELVSYNLEREGYVIVGVGSGEEGIDAAQREKPDLILLDIMLPGVNGLDVCRTLKGAVKTSTIPIIMVSARGEESDVVAGLELGADDYIIKPFSPKVLTARIRAVLRRRSSPQSEASASLKIHELSINPGKHETFLAAAPLVLTATEFRILHYLARHPGWVFTRQQIVDAVHGDDYPVTDRSIDVQIAGLRKKLGDFSEYIETVRGIGYRMREQIA